MSSTVMETTELVADSVKAAATLPDSMTFTIANAGSYKVTLTDLQTPVALGSLSAIVTQGLEVVARVTVVYPPSAPQTPSPASVAFNATGRVYRVHVVGA